MPNLRFALHMSVICGVFASSAALADQAVTGAETLASLVRIREAGMNDDWAYRRLADLCDKVGPRLSGSRQAEAAVEQIAAALRSRGLSVVLQPVKVPHWVRGEEQAEIIEYP